MFIQPSINNITYTPRDVIFVLDEFDQDVKTLLVNQTKKQMQMAKAMNIMETLLDNELKPKEEIIVNNIKGSEKNDNKQNETEKEEKKINIKSEQSGIDKINQIVAETTQLYNNIQNMNADVVTLEDLLTVFQGAVPNEGCIIIAMTNHFEEMKNQCPALFRAGRLTPVYFGNFDIDMLNKVSKYYFNKYLNFSSEPIKTITSSQVMELAVSSRLKGTNAYKYFCEGLKEFIPEVVIPETDCKVKPIEVIKFNPFTKDEIYSSDTRSIAPDKTDVVTDTREVMDVDINKIYHKSELTVKELNKLVDYLDGIKNSVIKFRIAEKIYWCTNDSIFLKKIFPIFESMCSKDVNACRCIAAYHERGYSPIQKSKVKAIKWYMYCIKLIASGIGTISEFYSISEMSENITTSMSCLMPRDELYKLLQEENFKELVKRKEAIDGVEITMPTE